jgi:hypothetical protein
MKNLYDTGTYTIPHFLRPSGCLDDYICKPFNREESIQIATFHEHRFAFYYWLKWTNDLNGKIPSLVTFDWHQDLCPPYKDKVEELKALQTNNKANVAFYTWARLEHSNDVQIQAAILLNKIRNVYVICRQKSNRNNPMVIEDYQGNKHNIYRFHDIEEFEKMMPALDENHIYWDIDLDYFTLCNPPSNNGTIPGNKYTYLKKIEIENMLSIQQPVIKWILNRIEGMTIAMEPDFCGGLKQSNKLFSIVERALFTETLFNRNLTHKKYPKWK